MAKVLTFTNNKGGVGKTSVSRATAIALSRRGKKVLAIDLDQQANLTRSLLGYGWEPTVGDRNAGALFSSEAAGRDVRELVTEVATGLDLIAGEKNDLFRMEKELETVHDGIAKDVIPALSAAMASEGESVPKETLQPILDRLGEIQQENLNWQKVLKKRLSPLLPDYDYVIIDLPPSVTRIPINAWVASQYLLVPVSDSFAVDGTGNLVRHLSDIIREYNQDIRFVFFFNKVRMGKNQYSREKGFRTKFSQNMIDSFIKEIASNPAILSVSDVMSKFIPYSLDVETANS